LNGQRWFAWHGPRFQLEVLRRRPPGILQEMASRKASSVGALLSKATRNGDAKKVVAVGAAMGTGAVAAKVVRDRLSAREDPRQFRLRDGEPVPDGIERSTSFGRKFETLAPHPRR
jgi:hypothetical protein